MEQRVRPRSWGAFASIGRFGKVAIPYLIPRELSSERAGRGMSTRRLTTAERSDFPCIPFRQRVMPEMSQEG